MLEPNNITPANLNFYIEGVRCSKCVQSLESLNLDHSDISESRFNKTHNLLTVKSHSSLSPQTIIERVKEKGYLAYFVENPSEMQDRVKKSQKQWLMRLVVTFFFSSNIMIFSFALYFGAIGKWNSLFSFLSGILYLPILFYSAIPLYQNAWQSIKRKQFSADLAIVIAFLWGSLLSYFNLFRGNSNFYFDSTSSFLFLILLARFFLYKAQIKIDSELNPSLLFKSSPLFQTSTKDGITVNKFYHEINPSEVITLFRNQTLPVDLVLQSEQAALDTSLYSGESVPRVFLKGDVLKAGMISLSDNFLGLVKSSFAESELSDIFNGIKSHQNKKTKAQSNAEVYSQYLLYTVSLLSLLILFLFGFQNQWAEGFRRALALFTIACPCSLAFAIPLASVVTIKQAMEEGLFVKTPLYFEKMKRLKGVVFDKTGTLTAGQMELHSWQPKNPSPSDLEILYSMEQNSHHPLAKGLIEFLKSKSTKTVPIDEIQETLGLGIDALYKGTIYSVRSISKSIFPDLTGFELRQAISPSPHTSLPPSESITSMPSQLLLQAYFKDSLRSESKDVIKELRKQNLETHLISGDRKDVVEAIGLELGFNSDEIRHSLSPQQKSTYIEELQNINTKHSYLMVGDGHNDALALSKSDLSLAVSGCAESSLRAADAYAQKGGLFQILTSIKFSKFYLRLTKQNVGLSLTYNFVAGILALLGFVDPMVAALLMPVNSIIVIGATLFSSPSK